VLDVVACTVVGLVTVVGWPMLIEVVVVSGMVGGVVGVVAVVEVSGTVTGVVIVVVLCGTVLVVVELVVGTVVVYGTVVEVVAYEVVVYATVVEGADQVDVEVGTYEVDVYATEVVAHPQLGEVVCPLLVEPRDANAPPPPRSPAITATTATMRVRR
jgi:hypothetical protein